MDKIIIENLSLQYSDGTESLRGISLGIREKAVTVLFGPAVDAAGEVRTAVVRAAVEDTLAGLDDTLLIRCSIQRDRLEAAPADRITRSV